MIVATIVPNCDYNMDMSMGLYININHFYGVDLVLMTDISGYNCRQTILQSMVYMLKLISKQLQKAPLLFVAKPAVSEFPWWISIRTIWIPKKSSNHGQKRQKLPCKAPRTWLAQAPRAAEPRCPAWIEAAWRCHPEAMLNLW